MKTFVMSVVLPVMLFAAVFVGVVSGILVANGIERDRAAREAKWQRITNTIEQAGR
jgi:hypothetical protein